jgi:broad specificity phosphatase PhoE
MGALTIHLVRHAPVHPDHQGTVYGLHANIIDITNTTDPDVSDLKREALAARFAALARKLPEHAPVLVTEARRTQQTARAVRVLQVNPNPVVGQARSLTEQMWGDWNERPYVFLMQRDPNFVGLRNKKPGWADITPPSDQTGWMAESFNFFTQRIGKGFNHIVGLPFLQGCSDLVVYAHGGTARAALVLFDGQTPDQAIAHKVPNLSVTTLRHDPAAARPWQVLGIGQM